MCRGPASRCVSCAGRRIFRSNCSNAIPHLSKRTCCMRLFAFAMALGCVSAAHAASSDASLSRTLKSLDPTERLEQLCDYTAMQYIRKNVQAYRPDRALAGAISDPKIRRDTIDAKGGAFRSRGKWYEMSYSCTADS